MPAAGGGRVVAGGGRVVAGGGGADDWAVEDGGDRAAPVGGRVLLKGGWVAIIPSKCNTLLINLSTVRK